MSRTGTSSSLDPRTRRRSDSPFNSGMEMSLTTASNRREARSETAFSPSPAVKTSKPAPAVAHGAAIASQAPTVALVHRRRPELERGARPPPPHRLGLGLLLGHVFHGFLAAPREPESRLYSTAPTAIGPQMLVVMVIA